MMGVPIDGPCIVFCDSESTIIKFTIPESTLRRNARGGRIWVIHNAHIHCSSNLADMLTEPMFCMVATLPCYGTSIVELAEHAPTKLGHISSR